MIDLHSEAKKMFDSVGLSDRKSYSLASSLNINASHRLRIFFFHVFVSFIISNILINHKLTSNILAVNTLL